MTLHHLCLRVQLTGLLRKQGFKRFLPRERGLRRALLQQDTLYHSLRSLLLLWKVVNLAESDRARKVEVARHAIHRDLLLPCSGSP